MYICGDFLYIHIYIYIYGQICITSEVGRESNLDVVSSRIVRAYGAVAQIEFG